jgi:surface antigen
MTAARRRGLAAWAAVVAISTIAPAVSADPWKDESGHGRGKYEDDDWGERCRGRDCNDLWHGGREAVIDPREALELIRCNRDIAGGVIGGAAGGVLGSRVGDEDLRTAATIGGAILGALIGGTVGREIDLRDQACIGHALEYGNSQEPVRWHDPEGVRYEVKPSRPYRLDDGRYCRDYELFADSGNRRRAADDTACRRPDGAWVAAGD